MLMDYGMVLKLLVLALAAGCLGFIVGRKTAHKPAGRIIFEKKDDGRELCIFKLKEDEEWLSQQKTVIFEVLHAGEDVICEPYRDEKEDE